VSGEPATEEQVKRAKRQQQERADVARETSAMGAAFNALQPLGYDARARALYWLARALEVRVDPPF
jgi:acyl-CoA reductase-like NAD-dependent aldehyde dehydrogenase